MRRLHLFDASTRLKAFFGVGEGGSNGIDIEVYKIVDWSAYSVNTCFEVQVPQFSHNSDTADRQKHLKPLFVGSC
jgi:hypothetical protein